MLSVDFISRKSLDISNFSVHSTDFSVTVKLHKVQIKAHSYKKEGLKAARLPVGWPSFPAKLSTRITKTRLEQSSKIRLIKLTWVEN